MIGAIAGDIIGSIYEGCPVDRWDFELFDPDSRFTDDTVLTIAIADIMNNGGDYADTFRRYYYKYPLSGFGRGFTQWAESEGGPYNSYGNGSAMRVSPIAWAYNDLESVLNNARKSAEVTHNHPDGIKGAQAIAAAIYLARSARDKKYIRDYITKNFNYDLNRSIDKIQSSYNFDVTCQGTVPESIIAFLDSTDYETAVRNAIWLGGDADTMACMSGAIAEAYYGGVPNDITKESLRRLRKTLRDTVLDFFSRFKVPINYGDSSA